MKIDFDDTYSVEFDGLSFQLQRKKVVKEHALTKAENIGKEVSVVIAYYGTLAQAVQGYLKQEIGNSDRDTFDAVLELMEGLMAEMDTVFDKVSPVIRKAYKDARTPKEAPAEDPKP